MIDRIGLGFSLMWRVLWCAFPLVTDYATAALASSSVKTGNFFSNDNVRHVATNYSDSLIIIACIFFLFAGSLVGYFYPTPRYGLKPYPKFVKVVISMTFGLLAFLYYLDGNKGITPAVCVYVAGVSFVAPAIIHLIHAAAIKFTGLKLGVTDDDLERINRQFRDEE